MSWTPIAPIKKSTGRPMASANVQVLKSGAAVIRLCLSGTLFDEIGAFEVTQVQEGDGDDLGCVRLDGLTAGIPEAWLFKFARIPHGGRRLLLPWPRDPAIARPRSTEPCQVLEQGQGFVVLRLPFTAWHEQAAPPPKAAAPAAGKPPPASRLPEGQVDPVVYLSQKGHGVERWTGGRFKVDGELKTVQQVLHLVNLHRGKADLPALTAEQLALG